MKPTKPFFTPHPRNYLSKNGYKTVIREVSESEIYILLVPKETFVPYELKKLLKVKNAGLIAIIKPGYNTRVLETYSSKGIRRRFRNKGVGLYMYSRLIDYALKHGMKVGSSNNRNHNSDAVWKRLDGLYKLLYRWDTDRYYVQKRLAA